MFYHLSLSLEHIGSLVFQPLLILSLIAIFLHLRSGLWKQNALNVCFFIIFVFSLSWRLMASLASSRYFAIVLLFAIFYGASLCGKAIFRKWSCSWLILITALFMIGKDFRYTSYDSSYCKAADVIRADNPQTRKSILVTLDNDYNKYLFVLKDIDIELLDLSKEKDYTKSTMLSLQLPLNYDQIYIAYKQRKNTLTTKNHEDILCHFPVNRKSGEELIILKQKGSYSAILPAIEKQLPHLSNTIAGSFTSPMPEPQRESIRKRMLSQGFSKFENKKFNLPQYWIPEIYSALTGKKQIYVSLISPDNLLIQAPQKLAMIYEKRLSIVEDHFFIADITANTPANIELGTHNYALNNRDFKESAIHGVQKVLPNMRQLIIFRLNADDVKNRLFNLRCIIEGEEVKIHHFYFFPCSLVKQ